MGRGIVHPTDAMQTEPWNADLLDYLAVHLADHGYDLKQTIELLATSQAYQSQSQVVAKGTDDHGYVYAGPRAKRLTAEQFVDCVWQLTDSAPTRFDAPVLRGKPAAGPAQAQSLHGQVALVAGQHRGLAAGRDDCVPQTVGSEGTFPRRPSPRSLATTATCCTSTGSACTAARTGKRLTRCC